MSRTVVTLFTLSASMAARLGAVSMAAHQISSQTWLALSLLSDSLAAVQDARFTSLSATEGNAEPDGFQWEAPGIAHVKMEPHQTFLDVTIDDFHLDAHLHGEVIPTRGLKVGRGKSQYFQRIGTSTAWDQ